jgi:hypothetical protein
MSARIAQQSEQRFLAIGAWTSVCSPVMSKHHKECADSSACKRGGVFALVLIAMNPVFILSGSKTLASSENTFHFENIASLDDMRNYLQQFPLGSPRSALRHVFVDEGLATLVAHPSQPGVEKYLYDINLCRYYIWRWNISADYDNAGRLLQLYINGDPLFAAGKQKMDSRTLAKGPHAAIYKIKRPRPEADLGEKELVFTLVDGDGDLKTTDDQVLTGGGPTRVSIAGDSKLYVYSDVEPWRSIFDSDPAKFIAAYPRDCAADIAAARTRSQPQAPQ